MIRNLFTSLGLLVLTLLVAAAVLLIGLFYDRLGIITLPEPVKQALDWRPVPVTIRIERQEAGATGAEEAGRDSVAVVENPGAAGIDLDALEYPEVVEWSNPLEDLPTATPPPTLTPTLRPTATPAPTPTPIPPLAPGIYRAEVILTLKDFVAQLGRWLELNKQLGADRSVLEDPAWRAEMETALTQIAATGSALGEIGPPPEEYRAVHDLLVPTGAEAQALRGHYMRALSSNAFDAESFRAAGENFKRIQAYLTEVVEAMLAAGWVIE